MKKFLLIVCVVCAVLFIFVYASGKKVVSDEVSTPRRAIQGISNTVSSNVSNVAAIGSATVLTADPYKHVKVSINSSVFDALVSDTPALQEQGLSGFKNLEKNELMLFVFEKPERTSFWMKDMLFPIDIVWLDSNKKVIFIEQNVSPNTYPKVFGPVVPAQYVMEFNAGTTARLGTKKGDMVLIAGGK